MCRRVRCSAILVTLDFLESYVAAFFLYLMCVNSAPETHFSVASEVSLASMFI